MPKTPKIAPAKSAPEPADYRIELRKLDELKPYDGNARTHADEQIKQIAASILEFGFTNPILADEFIRAGHGRRLAALNLYRRGKTIRLPNGAALPKGVVPVIDCSGWSEAQRKAYVLADNKIGLNSGWDDELLKLELGQLKGEFDLEAIGFSEKELAALLDAEGASVTAGDAGPQLDGLSYSIVIRCKDEAQQTELLQKLEDEGLTCEALIS